MIVQFSVDISVMESDGHRPIQKIGAHRRVLQVWVRLSGQGKNIVARVLNLFFFNVSTGGPTTLHLDVTTSLLCL
jgi:hypothetical protein